ncbi:hypothetical protein R6Q59_010471 [Mikania micrantha]
MASIYTCNSCGTNFNLHAPNLFPPDFYFEAGNKGTLSFATSIPPSSDSLKKTRSSPFSKPLITGGFRGSELNLFATGG